MARSKATGRKPKTPNQNDIKVGRVEKTSQVSASEKAALKVAAKQTPKTLQNKKNKRPISNKKRQQIKAAREALASGEIASEDQIRRKERDTRTLYIRFKDKQKIPADLEEVKALHKDIQVARVPRQSKKKIKYAYVEFGTEAQLEDAKLSIENKDNLYVDYVGIKSKGGGKPKHQRGGKGKNTKQINPTRLHISGLLDGMTEDQLKRLFPKCCKANIPKGSLRKGTLYGFVQFTNPADAKSAFEAAKKLTVQTKEGRENQRITVLYATATKHPNPKKNENAGEKVQQEMDGKENHSNAINEVKEKKTDQVMKDEGPKLENSGVVNGNSSTDASTMAKTSDATKGEKEESDEDTDSDDENMENDTDSEEEEENSTEHSKNDEKDVKSDGVSDAKDDESEEDSDDEEMDSDEESEDDDSKETSKDTTGQDEESDESDESDE